LKILPYNKSYCFLLLFFLTSCMVDKSHNREYLQKSLHNSTWEISNVNDQSRSDTISFSFGFTDTKEELNLIDIHSNRRKELCEFSYTKRKIRFVSENGFFCLQQATINSKKNKYVFRFKNDNLRFKRQQLIYEKIKIRRL